MTSPRWDLQLIRDVGPVPQVLGCRRSVTMLSIAVEVDNPLLAQLLAELEDEDGMERVKAFLPKEPEQEEPAEAPEPDQPDEEPAPPEVPQEEVREEGAETAPEPAPEAADTGGEQQEETE